MAEISKPDFTYLWSSGGATVAPSNVKIQTGWTAEVPPFQWENWSQNRQDQAIAHVLQHGVSTWDNSTEYQANKSYVQGSNGLVYKALTTNTNTNPVTDGGTNWKVSSASYPVATPSLAQALSSDTDLLTPLQLDNSFKGANQSTSANGFQKLPGGMIEMWGQIAGSAGGYTTLTFPIAWPTGMLSIVATCQGTATVNIAPIFNSATLTTTTITFAAISSSNTYTPNVIYWRAIGR